MRKNNLQKLIFALLIPVLYVLSATGINSVSEESFIKASRATFTEVKDFLNIIFNINYNGTAAGNWVERNLPLYRDSLNYTGIQVYDDNSSRFGYFDSALSSSQITNVKGLMSDIEDKELKGFYARTKITWLAEGQRLEYEVSEGGSTTVNNGFCYQNNMGSTYTTDTGRTVLNPRVGSDSAGWLCKNIYENMQHSDFINRKDRGQWFVKPMLRIDTADFSSNDTTKVVAIVVTNFDGSKSDSVIIRIRNFGNNNIYNGNYIENFYEGSTPLSLQVSGDTLNHGNSGYLESSQVDFKVYWFGLVDVWFDKMTVDDEFADGLFKGEYDYKIWDESTKENFAMLIYYLRNKEKISYSSYSSVNYVLNKMYEKIDPTEYAQAR